MPNSFQALGTTWWIEIFDTVTEKRRAEALADSTAFIATFEAAYSRFKPDSLVSRLNRERTLPEPPAECVNLLTYGKALYTRTGGHFNILTGAIQEARGYDAEYSFIPTADQHPIPGDPLLDLCISPEVITLAHGNLDLGGFGKGYLVDRVAERLQQEHDIHYFLINAGGDIFATSNHGEAVEIALEHPTESASYLRTTTLLNQGFAASSPFKRQWHHAGTTYSHLVSSSPVLQASFVKARTTADADAFATASLLMNETEHTQAEATEDFTTIFFNPATNELSGNPNFF